MPSRSASAATAVSSATSDSAPAQRPSRCRRARTCFRSGTSALEARRRGGRRRRRRRRHRWRFFQALALAFFERLFPAGGGLLLALAVAAAEIVELDLVFDSRLRSLDAEDGGDACRDGDEPVQEMP